MSPAVLLQTNSKLRSCVILLWLSERIENGRKQDFLRQKMKENGQRFGSCQVDAYSADGKFYEYHVALTLAISEVHWLSLDVPLRHTFDVLWVRVQNSNTAKSRCVFIFPMVDGSSPCPSSQKKEKSLRTIDVCLRNDMRWDYVCMYISYYSNTWI